MYLEITFNNGITEEFALGSKSSHDLINRCIEAGDTKEIKSVDKIIYRANKEYFEKVDSLEFYAQAAENNSCGVDGWREENRKMSERKKQYNRLVIHNDFIKIYDRANKLRIEILDNVKSLEDRKVLLRRCINVMRNMQTWIKGDKTAI